jgi:hypothetical protein
VWRYGTSRYGHPSARLAYMRYPCRRVTVQQKHMVAHVTVQDYNSFRLALALARTGGSELEAICEQDECGHILEHISYTLARGTLVCETRNLLAEAHSNHATRSAASRSRERG